jgi:predicted nucleic acid-binding protein
MRKNVIVNASPILALHDIGCLDIMRKLYGKVTIPEAVRREVTVRDTHTLDGYAWISVAEIADTAMRELFTSALHDGEVEVMILAKEQNADLVILDDGLARRHAKYLKLNVTGTVGVLLRAKQNGIISEVKPILDKLIQRGLYLSDDVYRDVLKIASE